MFGCECFPTILTRQNKFEHCSKRYVYLYDSNYKRYRCLDPASSRVYIRMHILFHENMYPYPTLQSPTFVPHISPRKLVVGLIPFASSQPTFDESLAHIEPDPVPISTMSTSPFVSSVSLGSSSTPSHDSLPP